MTLSPESVTHFISPPESVTNPILPPELDKEPDISLIVPVFNQERKVSYALEKIKQAIELAFSKYELIVVNDGSIDNTLNILRDIEGTSERMHTISYTPNRGKGYAVKQGVLHSRGTVVMFLDGDLDISPDSIRDYVDALSTSDLVIASKRHPKSSVTIPDRALLSKAFSLLIRVATGISQKDTQAGFKAGKGDMMLYNFQKFKCKSLCF